MASVDIKRLFLEGKMNKDVDERLLKNGEYRDAENIRVVKSDGSNAGAIENVKGNEALTSLVLTNAKTIGVLADEKTGRIFSMTTSDEKDIVMEYNKSLNRSTVVLESSKPDSVLNFSGNDFITGIVLIANSDTSKDLLIWTDDVNDPRQINIERAKAYGVDNFTYKDINLIKAPPKEAPQLFFRNTANRFENNLKDKFLAFAYRYKYLDGEYSALSSFTNYAFTPKKFKLDPDTQSNLGMENAFNSVKIGFNTGDKRVTDIQLFFKESGSSTVYRIENFNKRDNNLADNAETNYTFFNNKNYITMPEDELFRRYDNVPRKAKALEFISNRLLFGNYVEGYNMVDKENKKVVPNYNLYVNNNVLDYRYPDTAITTGDTVDDTLYLNFGDVALKESSRITFQIDLDETTIPEGDFSGELYYILDKTFTSAKALSTDENFVNFVTTTLTNLFIDTNTGVPPAGATYGSTDPFTIVPSIDPDILLIKAPTINYITIPSTSNWGYLGTTFVAVRDASVLESVKTNRDYEVGIIYEDEYKRSSPVLTTGLSSVHVPQVYSNLQNKIVASIKSKAPEWAKTYKFAVKESRLSYDTIYTTIFYADGNYRWCKLEGASKDKVKEGDILIVKSDVIGRLENAVEVEVLEVTSQLADFIDGNVEEDGTTEISELAGLYMKIKPNDFNMDYNKSNFFNYSEHNRDDAYARVTIKNIAQEKVGGVWVDVEIPANSIISINFEGSTNNGKWSYNKQFVTTQLWDTFEDWWVGEVNTLGTSADYFTVTSTTAGTPPSYNWFIELEERDPSFLHKARLTATINIVLSSGVMIFETKPDFSNIEVFHECSKTYDVVDGHHKGGFKEQSEFNNEALVQLDFFNCYVQGNGAESNKYKDLFISNKLLNDIRPSVVTLEPFQEVRRVADMTYSEVYNESTNVNGLNEFNLARRNYKDDLDKNYGSIQKLHARDTDVVVIQQDKWSKVLYGKDMLYNADGSSNVTSAKDVLGQQVPFKGEYGISDNPESFSYDGYNVYATDTKRGVVLRLGLNGLTEIVTGMKTWFKDAFKTSYYTSKVGAFDPYHDSYKLNIDTYQRSVVKDMKTNESYETTNAPEVTTLNYAIETAPSTSTFYYDATENPVRYQLTVNDILLSDTGFITNGGFLSYTKDVGAKEVVITITTQECGTQVGFRHELDYLEQEIKFVTINDSGDVGKSVKIGYTWVKEGYAGGGAEFIAPLINSDVAERKVYLIPDTSVEGVGIGAYIPSNSYVNIYVEDILGEDPVFAKGVDDINQSDWDKIGAYQPSEIPNTAKGWFSPEGILAGADFLTATEQILPDGRRRYSAIVSNFQGYEFSQPRKLGFVFDFTNGRSSWDSAEITEDVQYGGTCVAPNEASWVTYTLAKGAFTSTVSQVDADAQAQVFFDANKQDYADANGTCILWDGTTTLTISSSLPVNGKGYVEILGAEASEDVTLNFKLNMGSSLLGQMVFSENGIEIANVTPYNAVDGVDAILTADSLGKIRVEYEGDSGLICVVTMTDRSSAFPLPTVVGTTIITPAEDFIEVYDSGLTGFVEGEDEVIDAAGDVTTPDETDNTDGTGGTSSGGLGGGFLEFYDGGDEEPA